MTPLMMKKHLLLTLLILTPLMLTPMTDLAAQTSSTAAQAPAGSCVMPNVNRIDLVRPDAPGTGGTRQLCRRGSITDCP